MAEHANPAAHDEPPASTRGFWSLIATQFTGAFNDNCLKFLVIYLILSADLPRATQDRLIPPLLQAASARGQA